MGYETEFQGYLRIEPELIDQHKKFLEQFAEARHEGGCEWGGHWEPGKERQEKTLPSLHCPWELIEVDEWLAKFHGPCSAIGIPRGGKHYAYISWLAYLIREFLEPNGYTVNGRICWNGESWFDVGAVVVRDNVPKVCFVDSDENCESRAFC